VSHLFCVYAGTGFENKRLITPFVDKWFVGCGMNNDTGMIYVLLSSTQPAAVASSLPVIPPGLCLFAVAVLKWLLTHDGVSLFIKSGPPAGDVFTGVSMAKLGQKCNKKYKEKWQVKWSRIRKDPGTDFKVKVTGLLWRSQSRA
jgi:hypothetical protein